MSTKQSHSFNRYLTLVKRAAVDLKLADDAAVDAQVPAAQLSRLRRVRRELGTELRALETDRQAQKSEQEQRDAAQVR